MKSTMPVMVYGESTPNPNILKFVLNFPLLNGSAEYLSSTEAEKSPLARVLFSIPGVNSIFCASNFISVSKDDGYDWYELMPEIREAIKAFFTQDTPPFTEVANAEDATVTHNAFDNQIVSILNEYVKPAVEGDGGEIVFKSFKEGKVTLVMKGACRGCPSSTITLKSGIETLLKQMIPEVKEVVAESHDV